MVFNVQNFSGISVNISGFPVVQMDYNVNTGFLTGLFYPYYSNPAGYVTSSAGGTALQVTGSFPFLTGINLTGISGTIVTLSGGYLLISSSNVGGGNTNVQVTGSSTLTNADFTGISGISVILSGNYVLLNTTSLQNQITNLINGTGNFISSSQTGNFITNGQTGNFITSNQTGSFITAGQTGLLMNAFYPLSSNPDNYITSSQTGQFVTTGQTGTFGNVINTGILTGTFYPLNSNPSGYVVGSVVSILNGKVGNISLVGQENISIYTNGQNINISGATGILTGVFYPLSTNPLNYITSLQTGIFVTTGQTGNFGGGSFNTGTLVGTFVLNSNTGSFITSGQTGAFAPYYLGTPTIGGGNYGGTSSIAGIVVGDTYPNAYEKIELILEKLAPSKPLFLSASNFILTGTTYIGYMQGTNTSFSNIIVGGKPTGYVTGFYDGSTGILSGFINNQLTGQFYLAPFLTGISTGLFVYVDNDFYSGIAGKSNFWYYADASLSPSGNLLNSGQFSMELGHTTAGNTFLTGYNDYPLIPFLSLITSTTGTVILHTIDGVPSLTTNDSIITKFTLSNAVSAFYPLVAATVSSSQTNSVNIVATGNPLSGTTLILSGSGNVQSNKFISGWVPTIQGFSLNSSITNNLSGSTIFIDSISSQSASRVMAATGQYPSGFGVTTLGSPYNNNTSLILNEELQMLDGLIQNPPSINYSNFVPSGPNYLTIQTGSYQNYRWCCFNAETISNASQVTIQFNNTNNFGSSTIIPNFHLYIYVSGSIPTNGWIDGNTAYPGVGNPINNGDAALVVGSSSATSKQVTFGSSVKNGTVFARIGIPSGSNLSFGSITAS